MLHPCRTTTCPTKSGWRRVARRCWASGSGCGWRRSCASPGRSSGSSPLPSSSVLNTMAGARPAVGWLYALLCSALSSPCSTAMPTLVVHRGAVACRHAQGRGLTHPPAHAQGGLGEHAAGAGADDGAHQGGARCGALRCAVRAPRPAVCAKSALGRRQDPRQGNGVIFISGDVHVRALRPPAAH
jgi:hypothetical protein